MLDFSKNEFGKSINLPESSKIIFVSDLFIDEYCGGAELTSEALIESCPDEIFKLKSKDVTLELLRNGKDKFWIFGNYTQINLQLLPTIIANLKYSILEYDYKYCIHRSPEFKHDTVDGKCNCHTIEYGKFISAFMFGAKHLWWMSENQKQKYESVFPFLSEVNNRVLSSVFSDVVLNYINVLRSKQTEKNKNWLVLKSPSWIKGTEDCIKWCQDNNLQYETVWNLPYNELLIKLSQAEGLVFLPKGADTCPRIVIEAKLLNCKLHLNENVQHKDEEWFSGNIEETVNYLTLSTSIFWNAIKVLMNKRPTLSGYTTTLNCELQQYPYLQTIKSMLGFCDEVCVVDGGSTDSTIENLIKLRYEQLPQDSINKLLEIVDTAGLSDGSFDDFPDEVDGCLANQNLKIKIVFRDWSHPRAPVFDGLQKAVARQMCTSDLCWQMDCDEVVHEDHYEKILNLCKVLPVAADILALPVIEYWGGPEKVRMDIQPWKWRLSRNKSHITHGIPVDCRRYDENGDVYALAGSTDGCDMIHATTFERLPHISFYQQEIEIVRLAALNGDATAKVQYQNWFNHIVEELPGVFHYSWYDLPRKIRLYKNYWQNHWLKLWNKESSDTAENNMMFDLPWSEVTDDDIENRAKLMKDKLGGWIWHNKWDGKTTTDHLTITKHQPLIMLKK